MDMLHRKHKMSIILWKATRNEGSFEVISKSIVIFKEIRGS
jgi:hypothetical protein